jgi:hypothetical protein
LGNLLIQAGVFTWKASAPKPLGNVTPYDVYTGKYHEIIQRRKEVKRRTSEERRDYNRSARKKSNDP